MTKEERLAAERVRLKAMYDNQREISDGAGLVFGIDEAGRGPLCGPVVAGCCVLDEDTEILYLNDSKKISEKKRELIYEDIVSKAVAYGIGTAGPKRIDEINILNATYEAMEEAFVNCRKMLSDRIQAYGELASAPDFSGIGKAADNQDLPNGRPEASENGNELSEMLLRWRKYYEAMQDAARICVLVDGNRKVPGIHLPQIAVVKGDAKCPAISAASILAKVTRDRLMIEYDKAHPEYGIARHKGYGTKEHIEAIRKYGATDIYRMSFLKNIL